MWWVDDSLPSSWVSYELQFPLSTAETVTRTRLHGQRYWGFARGTDFVVMKAQIGVISGVAQIGTNIQITAVTKDTSWEPEFRTEIWIVTCEKITEMKFYTDFDLRRCNVKSRAVTKLAIEALNGVFWVSIQFTRYKDAITRFRWYTPETGSTLGNYCITISLRNSFRGWYLSVASLHWATPFLFVPLPRWIVCLEGSNGQNELHTYTNAGTSVGFMQLERNHE
jgi:hypothetical protein